MIERFFSDRSISFSQPRWPSRRVARSALATADWTPTGHPLGCMVRSRGLG